MIGKTKEMMKKELETQVGMLMKDVAMREDYFKMVEEIKKRRKVVKQRDSN